MTACAHGFPTPAACTEEISVGDLIGALDTDPPSYVHDECIPGGAQLPPWVDTRSES